MEFNDTVMSERTDHSQVTTEAEPRRLVTFHCRKCNTVLGDSFGVCGELRRLDSIMCLRVTNDVVVSRGMESGHKGEMAKCIYSALKCRSCHCNVGKVIHAAPSHLAAIRSIFLLCKANISCYILNSCSMVKASTISFDLKPLREYMNEMRWHFESQFDYMTSLKSKLDDRSTAREPVE